MPRYRNLENPYLISAVLAFAVFAAYLPVYYLDFTNFDDTLYVTLNRHVQGGLTWEGIRWALTRFHAGNWHPLTWISHMLDCQLYGLRPLGHHIINVLFHAANTIILFLWLRSLTRTLWRSALVAALFALHPLRVESVAWVAERKDVLSGFFGLLSLWAYTNYAHASMNIAGKPHTDQKEAGKSPKQAKPLVTNARRQVIGFYIAALALYLLGLFSKPMLVTWPFLMLLLDFWPLGRMTGRWGEMDSKKRVKFAFKLPLRVVVEKIPFFALAAGCSVITFLAQREGGAVSALGGDYGVSLESRISNVPVSYTRYLLKLIWPQDLAVIYPLIRNWPEEQVAAAVVLLLVITGVVLWRARRNPYALLGWFWYLGASVPIIGLVQVGTQSIADRYTYLPAIGLYLLFTWGIADLATRWRHGRALAAGAAVAVLLAYTHVDNRQLLHWQNSEALFRHALAVTKNNYMADTLLGTYFSELGDLEPAKAHYRRALQIAPNLPNGWMNLGCALVAQRQYTEAVELFESALSIKPESADAHSNLGNALFGLGRFDEAGEHYREAVRLAPDNGLAHYNLGNILARENNLSEATEQLTLAVKFSPQYLEGYIMLANVLAQQGKLDAAADTFRLALHLAPGSILTLYGYAGLLTAQGRWAEAAGRYSEILRAVPGDNRARLQLGVAEAAQGKLSEALATLTAVWQSEPTNAVVNYHLAATLASQHRFAESVRHYRTALKTSPDFPEALNNLAWILAANPDPVLRNGREAVTLAERACELTQYQQALLVGTLAAAYAEAGDFKAAVTMAEKAKALSDAAGDKEVSAKNADLLELYRSEKPYRDAR